MHKSGPNLTKLEVMWSRSGLRVRRLKLEVGRLAKLVAACEVLNKRCSKLKRRLKHNALSLAVATRDHEELDAAIVEVSSEAVAAELLQTFTAKYKGDRRIPGATNADRQRRHRASKRARAGTLEYSTPTLSVEEANAVIGEELRSLAQDLIAARLDGQARTVQRLLKELEYLT